MSGDPSARGPGAAVQAILDEAVEAHRRLAARDPGPIVAAAQAIREALGSDGKVLAFGNGGSAADSQHLAAELVGRFVRERAPLAAIALTTDTSVMTSLANDFGYEMIFARQVEALGRRGDVALGISTSGRSENIVRALATAERRGLVTIALTGQDGGAVGQAARIHINVPESSVARVQEVHRTILHVICELIEQST
jgi:D-sedoheptulose 7-phosphate isomerase